VIDVHAVLREFGVANSSGTVADYLNWVRSVAAAKRPDGDVSTLPWWSQANHVDEIADADRRPDATTFDGQRLAEERAVIDIDEFADRFQTASEYAIEDLASHLRSASQLLGRIVFTTLAVNRYRIRGPAIAALLEKHHNSVTKQLTEGLRREATDPEFKRLLNTLDAEISSRD